MIAPPAFDYITKIIENQRYYKKMSEFGHKMAKILVKKIMRWQKY